VHQVGPPPTINSQGDPLHCDQPLDLVRTHFLWYSHGGEWIASHHVARIAFNSIAKKKGHVSFEQTHVLPPPSL